MDETKEMIVNIRKVLILILFSCFFFLGCFRDENILPGFKSVPPKVEEVKHNNITVEMTAAPGQVEFDKDVILTIKVLSPLALAIDFVLTDDRLEGFEVSGEIIGSPIKKSDGLIEQIKQYSLTPKVSSSVYRIAPIAVRYRETTVFPVRTGWFPTKPMVFEPAVRVGLSGVADIFVDVQPLYVRPSLTTIWQYILIGFGVLIVLAFVVWLLYKVYEQIQVRKMSPQERAMRELSKLLAKNLIEKRKVKDFYLELTMIVRRYIERSYGVRAPEQTTEEFLEAISQNPIFDSATADVLKEFLESADLVKFAAFKPTPAAIDKSIFTAKEYISTDFNKVDLKGVRNV